MSKLKILITAPTAFELAPIMSLLESDFKKLSFYEFGKDQLSVFPMVTGVGMPFTAYALGKYNNISEMSFVVQIGLAGAFIKNLNLGQVVEIKEESFSDLGVEESDGSFTDIFSLGLQEKNRYPFTNGKIINDDPPFQSDLISVNGISLNRVHGTSESIEQTYRQFPADVETMEGAAFFYACKMQHVRFAQIRAISNYVEVRNRENWKIDHALDNLRKYMSNKILEWNSEGTNFL